MKENFPESKGEVICNDSDPKKVAESPLYYYLPLLGFPSQ